MWVLLKDFLLVSMEMGIGVAPSPGRYAEKGGGLIGLFSGLFAGARRQEPHRGRGRRIRGSDQAQRPEPVRALPLPQRKDAVVFGVALEADIPLLRLRQGRERHKLHNGVIAYRFLLRCWHEIKAKHIF